MNHGHVTPRSDGAKAKCGGPMLCDDCAKEQIRAGFGAPGGEDARLLADYLGAMPDGRYPPRQASVTWDTAAGEPIDNYEDVLAYTGPCCLKQFLTYAGFAPCPECGPPWGDGGIGLDK